MATGLARCAAQAKVHVQVNVEAAALQQRQDTTPRNASRGLGVLPIAARRGCFQSGVLDYLHRGTASGSGMARLDSR
jgi:hypothetical protein